MKDFVHFCGLKAGLVTTILTSCAAKLERVEMPKSKVTRTLLFILVSMWYVTREPPPSLNIIPEGLRRLIRQMQ